ncbi:salicylate synthase [Burkholderia guangdongensis]|uniref:salicylate synthase n=1 Tax=Burkholderia guangdongensis TaxID=1792500 RepID=UPI0015C98405|nr:salicylate synthase [Burkholderia guangdongensis]
MNIDRFDLAALEKHYERLGYWKHQTLGELLSRAANTFSSAPALIDGEARLTYADFDLKVDRLAAGLDRLGIVAGDRVLMQLPNCQAFAVCLFALFRIGALPIMATPAHREKDLQALCRLAEPSAYVLPRAFLGFDYLDLAQSIRRGSPSIRHILVDGEPGPWLALNQVDESPRAFRAPAHTDTALLLLSGGTTGTPKLIPRTHADYLYNATESARLCGLSADSAYLVALPAAHNFPLACPGLLGTLIVGGRVVMARAPGADEAFPLIEKERVTHTALVPALVKLWLEARKWDTRDLSTLKLLQVGGARLEPALARQIAPALGCQLQQVFGMAEGLLCHTRLDDPMDVVLNTQGRPLCPDDELRIVGSDGLPVAAGQVGELQVRGPYTIHGYYRAPAHNARCFTSDGFYRSGDLVQLTPEGNLVVHGRVKEQINRAGEKIAAAEIELAVDEHPRVESCAVVAVPDERLGERTCAVIIARGQPPALADIQTFLRDAGLPRHKLPDQLLVVSSWPLTTVGKIDKPHLVALARNASSATGDGPAENRRTYTERLLAVQGAPLDILTALACSGIAQEYTLYEHPEEWSIGLGRVATVRVDAERAELVQGARRQTFRRPRLVDAIGAATAEIAVDDWRAYGVARFELSRIFHGLRAPVAETSLLELFVPELEVRIRDGQARLRAIDPLLLPALQAHVEQADRQSRDKPVAPADEAMLLALRQHDEDSYRANVKQAVEEINARKYQKVILSRRIPLPAGVDLVETYRAGRARNTPARSFLIQLGESRMAGFSPETVVEVSADGWVSTQPLAGTRALGASREEEERLRMDLLNDAKEVAEHAVSVKLAQDEVAKVCEDASVSEFMNVLRRGSVQHLASRVSGRLTEGRTAWDAFEALFPAVTASGIPKQAGIEAIKRFERTARGWYSGCVLLVDSQGGMDAALVLRSIYQRGTESWLQAGAGIVGLSRPARELEETNEKLACILKYVVLDPVAAGEALEGA